MRKRPNPVFSKLSFNIGCVLAWSVAASIARADEIIFDMDTVVHQVGQIADKDQHKIPCGAAELVDGKFGKAVKFSFVPQSMGGFMTARLRPTLDWDKSAGFSFWVKGDGSGHWGGIELIDRDDYSLRYGYCFPIDSTEWKKIIVPWRDVIPELAAPLVNPQGGYAPSKFGNFWFGKWFYWRSTPLNPTPSIKSCWNPQLTSSKPRKRTLVCPAWPRN